MRLHLMAGTFVSTVTLTLASGAALAQTARPEPAAKDPAREVITVTATRIAQRTDEVPATVSVITSEQIEDELVTDIKDLVRFEPGVSVRNSPARFTAAFSATGRDGNAGFNIRGLEGNRVLIQTDGVRVPDSYAFGPTANGRGDYVDLGLLKSVEILRGPASALYGSDGVAGAVSFITKDPEDLVQDGRRFGVRARTVYASADDSIANSLMGAGVEGDWSAMLANTLRDAHEQENLGEIETPDVRRTAANPLDIETGSLLGKIVWAPGEAHRFRLTVEQMESDLAADVLSGQVWLPVNGNPVPLAATSVINLEAADTTERSRIAFDHAADLGDGLFRSAKWAVYAQDSKTRQFTFEDRNTAADRTRDNYFDNNVIGANGQLEAAFATGAIEHRLIAGADYSVTEQSGIRSGTVPTPPDVFPARAFPVTDYTLGGIFLQDQIALLDGTLVLYPALRYDTYKLEPSRDPLFPAAVQTAPSDDSQVSPKLGIVAFPANWLGAFVNYAAGYKAPEPSQVNNAFSNIAFNYTSIPNPDLKPESSDSIEVGVRLREASLLGADWSGELVGFAAEYEDFISQVVVSGAFTPANPAIYQYVNLTDVSISGVEAKLNAAWDNGFGLRLAASSSGGDVRGNPDAPLASIDPAKLIAGLTYTDPRGVFGGQVITTFMDGKDLDTVTSAALFRPASSSVLDITAYWNITDWVTLRAGAFNVTDEKYWHWSDVRGLAGNSATRDAFTQPGANYSASLTLRY